MPDAQKIVLEDIVCLNADLSMIVENALMAQTNDEKAVVLERLLKLSEFRSIVIKRIIAL